MPPQIQLTKDGSSTLYSEKFRQYYHNPNGAATESLHVFFQIPRVIEHLNNSDSLTVLEVGFGTGLNFLLLLDLSLSLGINIPIHFYSIEASPIDQQTARNIDFTEHLKNSELHDLLPQIFSDLKAGFNHITPHQKLSADLTLFVGTFDDFDHEKLEADFIFHDPFSPEVNPELWTAEVFEKLKGFSKETTVLATYCAASKARGAMAAAGWNVARAKGALGKREMTVASHNEASLNSFKRVNEKKLAERYQNGDFG